MRRRVRGGNRHMQGRSGTLRPKHKGAARIVSLLELIDPAGGEGEIGEGKRLIRVGDDRGVSLSERLAYRLHRLAWRTPFHAFRLRGRFPLKLLAVPKDPKIGRASCRERVCQYV